MKNLIFAFGLIVSAILLPAMEAIFAFTCAPGGGVLTAIGTFQGKTLLKEGKTCYLVLDSEEPLAKLKSCPVKYDPLKRPTYNRK